MELRCPTCYRKVAEGLETLSAGLLRITCRCGARLMFVILVQTLDSKEKTVLR